MSSLLNIKRTQIEMVRDRGYDVSAELPILNMTADNFNAYLQSISSGKPGKPVTHLSRVYNKTGSTDTLFVFYASKEKTQVAVDTIKSFTAAIDYYKITEAILITDAKISTDGQKVLSEHGLKRIQRFMDYELVYNPIEHIDTPRHELIPRHEVANKLREMKVSIHMLPLIPLDDAVVKYYGWEVGDLIRIHRDDSYISVLVPKSINYRVVN